jgi:hypothetical protein
MFVFLNQIQLFIKNIQFYRRNEVNHIEKIDEFNKGMSQKLINLQ